MKHVITKKSGVKPAPWTTLCGTQVAGGSKGWIVYREQSREGIELCPTCSLVLHLYPKQVASIYDK